VVRSLIWLARRLGSGQQRAEQARSMPVTVIPGAGVHGPGTRPLVTVRLPDGRLVEGEPASGPAGPAGQGSGAGPAGGDRPLHPTVVLFGQPGDGSGQPGGPRRRWYSGLPRWVRWGVPAVIILVVFRRIVAWAVLAVLSGALHLFGANVNLPHVTFGWPWSSSSSSSTTLVGPLVLNKIEGIDKPALGSATFDFMFSHSVNKPMGILPCWYSATFSAVGHASATVNLNPGASWWKASTGHYVLKVLSKPSGATPGQVSVTMALPLPQLPQSVHDVSVDNTLSKPVSTDHSWTYPGVACGLIVKPQFAQSVLYSQAQQEAFKQATTVKGVTQPLIAAAEKQASTIIGGNFITPTLNSLNYKVSKFTIRWVAPPAPAG
jgi:hypothetical protein